MTFIKFQLEYFCYQAELHATLDHCVLVGRKMKCRRILLRGWVRKCSRKSVRAVTSKTCEFQGKCQSASHLRRSTQGLLDTYSQSFLFTFCIRIIDLPGGQINDPSPEKHYSLHHRDLLGKLLGLLLCLPRVFQGTALLRNLLTQIRHLKKIHTIKYFWCH